METVKITKRDYFENIINYINGNDTSVDADAMIAFCEKEIAALANRAAKAKERSAAKAEEADELLEVVYAAITAEPATRDEIFSRIEGEDLTVNKVGARLTKLFKAGRINKEEKSIVDEETGKSKKAMTYFLA